MTNNKCPICGKSGLPDYRKEVVVCPACNTDLNAFLIIDSIDSNNNNIRKGLLGMAVFVIFVLSFILLKKEPIPPIADNNIVQQLKDSIANLMLKNAELAVQISEPIYSYTVRKGDCFYKISKLLYGSEKYGNEIAKINGMVLSSAIYPGTSLKLPKK